MKPRLIVLKIKGIIKEPYAMRALWYSLFFIAALTVFVYARFPSEILAPLVEKHVSSGPLKVTISRASLSFPPGLSMTGVTVMEKSSTGLRELVTAKSVVARPSILAAVTGEMGGAITARLLGGELEISGRTDGGPNENIDIEFEFGEIDPGLSTLWARVPWGRLGGKINGEGVVSIVDQDILRGSGELKATLSDGLFKVGKMVSSDEKEIKLGQGVFELKYKLGKVSINRAEIQGDEVEVSMAGDIMLSKRPEFSRLNMKISIKLSGELQQKFGPLLAFFKKDNSGASIIHIGGIARAPSVR